MAVARLQDYRDVGVSEGDRLSGFTVKRVTAVSTLHFTAVELEHDVTKAKYLHLARQDTNNTFAVGFRTMPPNNSGVPHILEHTTLCGSQRFPCRDPFFKMLTRSLATFMNAYTASDYTLYPFSTINPKDYSNLMSVYLDAAFFPLLSKQDFQQEGWRLEHEKTDDATTPIVIKGVVYNEMKGALSSSESIYYVKAFQELFSDGEYKYYSGGEPEHIPSLSWEQLKAFHDNLYHPSNARFYSYGDLPLAQHLEQLQREVLSKFSQSRSVDAVPLEKRWSAPRVCKVTGPVDPMSADTGRAAKVSISFLMNDVLDIYESFVLRILSMLLLDGPTSLFYRELVESGLGTDFSPNTSYDGHGREAVFAVGVQGVNEEEIDQICKKIMAVFQQASEQPADMQQIESFLHQFELSQKSQSTRFGLNIASSLFPVWTHGGDIVEMLSIGDHVKRFRNDLASSPTFLQDKIKHYFLNNPHQLTVVMTPDEKYGEKIKAAESQLLQSLTSKLTPDNKNSILKEGIELQKQQSKSHNVDVLPMLQISDIERTKVFETYHVKNVHLATAAHPVSVNINIQPTNGVAFFRAMANVNDLPAYLEPYVPLFCSVITSLGAGGMDHRDLAQAIRMSTGGLSCGSNVWTHHDDEHQFQKAISFGSHALDRNIDAMFDLWQQIFTEVNFSNSAYLQTLIKTHASETQSGLSDSGHSYALSLAASTLSATGALSEQHGGLTQVALLQKLAALESHEATVLKLKEIASYVFSSARLRCCLNDASDNMPATESKLTRFLSAIPHNAPEHPLSTLITDSDFTPRAQKLYVQTAFPVNFCAKMIPTVPYTHEDSAPLSILASLMSSKFLHREIREKGGAYGGGASARGGAFKFYSYRDPNTVKTLEAFDAGVAWASGGSFTDNDVVESKLSVFQSFDAPVAPGSRGFTFFSSLMTPDILQQRRQRLLSVSKEDLVRTAQKYLVGAPLASTTVFGNDKHVAAFAQPDWTVKALSSYIDVSIEEDDED